MYAMTMLTSPSFRTSAFLKHSKLLSTAVKRSAFAEHRHFSLSSRTQTSTSSIEPIGVQAALRAASDPSFKPRPTLLEKEFSLAGRVAVITGARRGLGLEMAEALAEAGAAVYCLDLPSKPDETFTATQIYVSKLGLTDGSRLEYVSIDVTDQRAMWDVVEKIATKEGRLDACVAAAGILVSEDCLEHSAEAFQKQMNVNVNGVLYTAQAAGRQMVKFGTPGSIVLMGSLSGSIANMGQHCIAYNSSKSAVIQMGRSLACELGPRKIRVNTLSPGYFHTSMTASLFDGQPRMVEKWSSYNPLGRIAKPNELRGVITWLTSDASSFCTGSDIMVTGGQHAW